MPRHAALSIVLNGCSGKSAKSTNPLVEGQEQVGTMFPIDYFTEKINSQDDSAVIDASNLNLERGDAFGYLMAGNQELSTDVLLQLSQANNYKIRLRIAENSCTPPALLNELAEDMHPEVRVAVADNPNAPYEALERLAADECIDVRYGLAENSQLPISILLHLINDDNPYVASRANKTANRVSNGGARQERGLSNSFDQSARTKYSIRNFVNQPNRLCLA